MLPGKQFKPEDVLAILRRRIWILLVPAALIAVGTAVVARKLPDRFRSEAVILVVPQQVPEDYVRSTIRSDVETRLQTISQQILSRTRLERIIENFKLYPEERRTGIMQDVVERDATRHPRQRGQGRRIQGDLRRSEPSNRSASDSRALLRCSSKKACAIDRCWLREPTNFWRSSSAMPAAG